MSCMSENSLRVRDLVQSVVADGRQQVRYTGSDDIPFQGLTLRFAGRRLQGKFSVLVTDDWGPRLAAKYAPPETTLSEKVTAALEAGARGVVLPEYLRSELDVSTVNCFFVENTQLFTFQVMEAVKLYRGASRVTAITGSAGKSTTKAMVTHAMKRMPGSGRVYSPGSSQNVATSMVGHLSQTHLYDHSVLEVAGSCFLHWSRNNFWMAPNVAVVTSISEAHLDYMGSLEGVARKKSKIFDGLPSDGVAIVNQDAPHSDHLIRAAQGTGAEVVSYGETPGVTVQLIEYNAHTGLVRAGVDDELICFHLQAPGKHMALNALAVLAVLRAHGFEDWRAGVLSLETFRPLSGRGQRKRINLDGGRTATLIDEAYNANPASMRAAVDVLHNSSAGNGGRKIAILGDMLEMGSHSEKVHLGLLSLLASSELSHIHLFGPQMQILSEAAKKAEIDGVTHWSSLDDLRSYLQSDISGGDLLLVKGAHGTGLHRLVEELCSTT